MGVLSWIFLGFIAGALAKFIMPGKDPGGCLITVVIGIAGAVVMGLIGTVVGFGKIESFDIGSILLATIGALITLIIYRILKR
jgi:uncharacterized membrane protein YeaQ/YmgE (transglycosylase-associated protein family)